MYHILHARVFVVLGPLNVVYYNNNYNQLHSMQPTLQPTTCLIMTPAFIIDHNQPRGTFLSTPS